MTSSHRRHALKPLHAKLESLLNGFLGQANQTPQQASLPLFIAQQRCGLLFHSTFDALRELPFVRIDSHVASIGLGGETSGELNHMLALVAQRLKAAGHAPGWRGELLDVWSEQGDSIAGVERGVVRPLGLVTKAVHLNGFSLDGGVWVARRSLNKATDPGMWDTLVGGLVSYQEDPEVALVRETDEEAGLEADQIAHRTPLRTITRMRRQVNEGFQFEDVLTCECVLSEGVIPQNRDGEVMQITCLAVDELLEMLEQAAFTIEASIVLAEALLRRCGG